MTLLHHTSVYLKLAHLRPGLRNRSDAKSSFDSRGNSFSAIKRYLASQPSEYQRELRNFSKINTASVPSTHIPSCWVVVVCDDSGRNITRTVEEFDRQAASYGYDFELCFVIGAKKDSVSYKRLVHSVETLLQAKRFRPHVHIVPKMFSRELDRRDLARKYGFDYCLQRISEQPESVISNAFIIGVESDTESLSRNFMLNCAANFGLNEPHREQTSFKAPQRRNQHLKILRRDVDRSSEVVTSELYRHLSSGGQVAICSELYARSGGYFVQ